jgi:dTDP-4-amino-4,6-dideoxygalactose transaminase
MEQSSQSSKQTLIVGRPNVLDRDGFMDDLTKILDSRLLTNDGPFVLQLERDVAAFLRVPHVIAVSNATAGLELTLRAVFIGDHAKPLRGEVIVPAYTFAASVHAIAAVGLTPVFCDVCLQTHQIDLASAEVRRDWRRGFNVGI